MIVYDSTSYGAVANNSTLTVSHTTAGDDRLLVVAVTIDDLTITVSAITYNGVAMTLADSYTGLKKIYLYYLVAPALGANNIVVTLSSTPDFGLMAVSYTGVNQTSPLDATIRNTDTTSPFSGNLVTSFANEVVVGAFADDGTESGRTPIASVTERQDVILGESNFGGFFGEILATSPGTYTIGYTDNYDGENTKLLLHFLGDDASTTFTDSTGRHTFSRNGNAQIDTAQSKFGGSSLLLDGTGDSIYSADSDDWNICSTVSENWTICFWMKFNATTGLQYFMTQFQNVTNYWDILHYDGNGLRFICVSGESNFIFLDYAGEINDTDWHHIALIKVAGSPNALWALYIDGTQVSYVSTANSATFTGPLYIGEQNAGGYVNGWIDEVRIQKSNYFGADPQADLSDTITSPAAAYGGVFSGTTYALASFKEIVAPGTHIKTKNGIAKANIKTLNTLATANAKTINGLT